MLKSSRNNNIAAVLQVSEIGRWLLSICTDTLKSGVLSKCISVVMDVVQFRLILTARFMVVRFRWSCHPERSSSFEEGELYSHTCTWFLIWWCWWICLNVYDSPNWLVQNPASRVVFVLHSWGHGEVAFTAASHTHSQYYTYLHLTTITHTVIYKQICKTKMSQTTRQNCNTTWQGTNT